MEPFNYDNIWFNISTWSTLGAGGLAVLLSLIIMSNPFGKRWIAVWVLSAISFVGLTGFIVMNQDREEAKREYSNQVVEHVKTTGKFDKVEGEYTFSSEAPDTFIGYYGDDLIDCYGGLEPGASEVEFGCGANFTPLNEIHAEYLKSKVDTSKTE